MFIPPGFANGMYLTECIKYINYIEAISLTHTWTQTHTTLENLQQREEANVLYPRITEQLPCLQQALKGCHNS